MLEMVYQIMIIIGMALVLLYFMGYIVLLLLGKAPKSTEEKIDELTDLLYCLVSERLDAENMKELQSAGMRDESDVE